MRVNLYPLYNIEGVTDPTLPMGVLQVLPTVIPALPATAPPAVDIPTGGGRRLLFDKATPLPKQRLISLPAGPLKDFNHALMFDAIATMASGTAGVKFQKKGFAKLTTWTYKPGTHIKVLAKPKALTATASYSWHILHDGAFWSVCKPGYGAGGAAGACALCQPGQAGLMLPTLKQVRVWA